MALAGSHVIHPRLQAHHKRTLLATMKATGTITRASTGEPEWVPGQGVVEPTPTQIWSGAARIIQRTRTATSATTSLDTETLVDYQITIPAVGAPDVKAGQDGDLFTVNTCPDDPELVGRVFRIDAAKFASTMLARTFVVVDRIEQNNPKPTPEPEPEPDDESEGD